MIINKEMCKLMYEELNDTKQVSKLAVTEDNFINWCHTINTLAGMSHRKKMLAGDELVDFEVPNGLNELVVPRKISTCLGDEFRDLRGKSYSEYSDNLALYGMNDAKVLDSIEFNRVSKAIAGSRKKNLNSNNLDELSRATTEEKYRERFNVLSSNLSDCLIKANSTHYVPIDFVINYMEDEFYTQKVQSTVLRWFSNALDNLN